MLALFRNNKPLTTIFLLVFTLVMLTVQFIHPRVANFSNAGIFGLSIYNWIESTPYLLGTLTFLLIMGQALYLNWICNHHKINKGNTFLPALFLIYILGSFIDFQALSPILIANLFLLIAFHNLLSTYKAFPGANYIFNAGLFIAIASTFYFSYVVFLLFAFVGLSIMRAYRTSEWIILILGFLCPYFLAGVGYFWFNQLPYFLETQFTTQLIPLDFVFSLNNHSIIVLSTCGLFVLWSLVNSTSFYLKTNIKVRKNISLVFWMLIIGSLSIFCQPQIGLNHLIILSIPLAIFLAFNFALIKNKTTAEFLFFILLVLTLAYQYKDFFISIIT